MSCLLITGYSKIVGENCKEKKIEHIKIEHQYTYTEFIYRTILTRLSKSASQWLRILY